MLMFMAVGDVDTAGSGKSTVLTSPDGITWTPLIPNIATNLVSIAWSGTQFVAADASGTHTSSDGVNWSP
jgi:hypothetical protein